MICRRYGCGVLIGMLLVGFYVISYSSLRQYQNMAGPLAGSHHGIWDLPPAVVSVIAGEFKGLMADYFDLEAGAEMGTEVIRDARGKFVEIKRHTDWQAIHRLFTTSQYLDPSFQQTYMVAEGTLPWEGKMVLAAQEILKTAAKNRPWDWQPERFIGFNTYFFLRNPGEAGKIFLRAAKVPDAPHYLAILGARLAMEGGDTKVAIILLKSMLSGKSVLKSNEDDIRKRLKALEGVAVLENGILLYKKNTEIYQGLFLN